MGKLFFALAMLCYWFGLRELSRPEARRFVRQIRSGQFERLLPLFLSRSGQEGTASQRVELKCPNCGGGINETDRQCPYCGSTLIAVSLEEREVPRPQKLNWIKRGGRVKMVHPVEGELTVQVIGEIVYEELWQRTRDKQSPWEPTGNAFAGFWLSTKYFLLNWQNRFYLLDERITVSDNDIRRDFAPHAHKFGQSDQTAVVFFDYPPGRWRIDDIGKFRVQSVEVEGLEFRPRAIGRFIHASGEGERVLVVEDYESGGGGQDTVWKGYRIQEKDVLQV